MGAGERATEEEDEGGLQHGFGACGAFPGAMVSRAPGSMPMVCCPAAVSVLGAIGSPGGTPMWDGMGADPPMRGGIPLGGIGGCGPSEGGASMGMCQPRDSNWSPCI